MKKPSTTPRPLRAEEFTWRTTRGVMKYLLYLPKDYDGRSGRTWPLLLFLHGAGERGTNLGRVAIHGPLSQAKAGQEFPFIIVAPLCPADGQWANEPLLQLLVRVGRRFAVDMNRVYLTGLSMGGYGTWNLGLAHPEKFAAIAPICGGGELITILLARNYETNRLAAIKELGVWAFHGGKDTTVPVEESERTVAFLKQAGCRDVRLTVYPGAGHNSWVEAYKDSALYEWFLQHERKPIAQARK